MFRAINFTALFILFLTLFSSRGALAVQPFGDDGDEGAGGVVSLYVEFSNFHFSINQAAPIEPENNGQFIYDPPIGNYRIDFGCLVKIHNTSNPSPDAQCEVFWRLKHFPESSPSTPTASTARWAPVVPAAQMRSNQISVYREGLNVTNLPWGFFHQREVEANWHTDLGTIEPLGYKVLTLTPWL